MKETHTFIYGLYDPVELGGKLRYIGKANKPSARFSSHLSDKRETAKKEWIDELRKVGTSPILKIIQKVPYGEWQFWEKFWIRLARYAGCKLENTTSGGWGESPDDKLREKISSSLKGRTPTFLGRHHSEESRAKIKEARARQVCSPETRAKMSASHMGNKSMSGMKHTVESRLKMSESLRKRWARQKAEEQK